MPVDQEAEMGQEVGPSHELQDPFPIKPFPPARLHLLEMPPPPKRASP